MYQRLQQLLYPRESSSPSFSDVRYRVIGSISSVWWDSQLRNPHRRRRRRRCVQGGEFSWNFPLTFHDAIKQEVNFVVRSFVRLKQKNTHWRARDVLRFCISTRRPVFAYRARSLVPRWMRISPSFLSVRSLSHSILLTRLLSSALYSALSRADHSRSSFLAVYSTWHFSGNL